MSLAGFADGHELEQYWYHSDSLYLGSLHEDHGLGLGDVGFGDPHGVLDNPRSIAVLAGAKSGKSRSILLQNAIRWPHPLLMIDLNGAAASITGMRRGTIEQAKGTGRAVVGSLYE